MRQWRTIICIILTAVLAGVSIASAQELKTINLPAPEKTGGMPLMDAFMNRTSNRAYTAEKLPAQELSNILWSAWGINRPDGTFRTAPSAYNSQAITVYAILEEGAYRYNAAANTLEPVVSGDIRSSAGQQDFVSITPLNLVYVSDLSKMMGNDNASKVPMAMADTGFVSQNVYLYCGSKGLGTVVRALFDRDVLSEALKLGPDQYITLTQTVGFKE